MLSVKSGNPIAVIRGGPHEGEVLGVTDNKDRKALGRDIEFEEGTLEPILDIVNRSVEYIAGPSGSGKSTFVAGLVLRYKKLHADSPVIVFSRSDMRVDPAFAELVPYMSQALIGEELLKTPVDITKLEPGTVLIFDDIGTIHDDKLRKAVQKIIMDCAEVGRKFGIYMIVTSHLINPADRNFGRVMMNEMQFLTVFPGGGSAHAIEYVLKKYLGMNAKQIRRVLDTTSRWVRFHTHAPRWAMEEKAAYIV